MIYDINGKPLVSDDVPDIKSYFADEMANTVLSVRTLQQEPNLTFFVITDIHAYWVEGAETLYKESVTNMRNLLESVPCNGVINLGDTINGNETAAISMNYGNAVSNEFRKIPLPYYPVIGNHDDNRYYENTSERLDGGKRFQVFINPVRNVYIDSTGLNYYVDYDEFKIRIVYLNSTSAYTYKYTDHTCEWLEETALDTPDGYGVLVCTHISPEKTWNYNQTEATNGTTILSHLATYAESNDVLGIVCGHNHLDCAFSTPFAGMSLGCNKFISTNGSESKWPAGATIPQRTHNTASEDLWTVMIIRPNSRKINFVRFGAGNDYEIAY